MTFLLLRAPQRNLLRWCGPLCNRGPSGVTAA
jgi:hypothetical protein